MSVRALRERKSKDFLLCSLQLDKAGERNKEQHINVRKFNVKRVNGNEIREKGDDFVERRANLTSLKCEEIHGIERRANNTFYSNLILMKQFHILH